MYFRILRVIFFGANKLLTLWTDAGHDVNQVYDMLYIIGRDDIVVGVGGEGGILPNCTILPNVGGYLPIIDQGNATAGYCSYRHAIPVDPGGRLDINSNFGFRKIFLPQVSFCIKTEWRITLSSFLNHIFSSFTQEEIELDTYIKSMEKTVKDLGMHMDHSVRSTISSLDFQSWHFEKKIKGFTKSQAEEKGRDFLF
uniref:Uncharacterized protein n=1 Tax=Solanum lycopersicum TaxID=4081 RepID=A0A3Q7HQA4_SOLLC